VPFRQTALAKAIHAFLYFRLTAVGRICFVLLLFFGLGGASSLMIPLYIPWGFFFVLMLIAVLSSSLSVPGQKALRVTRLPVPGGTAGQTLIYEIEIENLTKRPLYQLELTEWLPPRSLVHVEHQEWARVGRLAPGEVRRLRLQLKCTRRGAFRLGTIGVLCAFPLGIWRGLRRSTLPMPVLVYPAYRPFSGFDVPGGRQYQPGGMILSSHVGESPEFMHTREYREGDNPRHIHWSSWARRGEPVIKVYQEEYFVRVALLLDCEASAASFASFEAAISLSASVADALARQDAIIDLFAAGEDIHHFQAGSGLGHVTQILEILACVGLESSVEWDALASMLAPGVQQFSAVVLVLLDWDAERAALVQRLRVLGLQARVLVVRDEVMSMPFPDARKGLFVQLPVARPELWEPALMESAHS
jgi:uncharacterized protein (DUF58 family)